MAPASLGRGKPLRNQTKEVLCKLHDYFAREIARDPRCSVRPAQLVVHATGVSPNALRRALGARRAARAGPAAAPPRRARRAALAGDLDAQAVRRVIHGFYARDEEFPAMQDLYLMLKAEVDYQGSLCTLRRDVARLGFRWLATEDGGSALVERHSVRFAREQYLTQLEAYRGAGRDVVYVGEVALAGRAPRPAAAAPRPAEARLTLLLAGGAEPLLHTLQALPAPAARRDAGAEPAPGEREPREQWFRSRLLPALRPASVVVLDAGPARARAAPRASARRRELLDWLAARDVPHCATMYTPQLYRLVQLHRGPRGGAGGGGGGGGGPEALLRAHGHAALRVPPLHPDLNPARKVLLAAREYAGAAAWPGAAGAAAAAAAEGWAEAVRQARAEERALHAAERAADAVTERAAPRAAAAAADASEDSGDSD